MSTTLDREAVVELPNPLGLAGIEFVEYTTPRPQALGHVLETAGFRPVARHRSREVLLYRQGGMNVVVNAHGVPADEPPRIAALALRVRDAGAAWRRVVELGGWPLPVQVQPMELHIPGIHGAGTSRIYFVDRWADFSIFDVDFVPIPTVAREVPALAGLHWFGVVQYVDAGRSADWQAFYAALFGFGALADDERFGILPRGTVLRSPCGSFFLQLVEPAPGAADGEERLQRVAFGTPDVAAAVRAWRERGVEFVDGEGLRPDARGALTREALPGVMFELVRDAGG